MAAPFDFSRYSEESEGAPSGVRRLPGFGEAEHSIPWEAIAAFLVLVLAAVVVVRILHRRMLEKEKERQAKLAWQKLHEICVERGLTTEEERFIVSAIREMGVTAPDRVVISENRFLHLVAPEVRRLVGEKACDRIRRKLFYGGTEVVQAAAALGGTHDLKVGQKLQLHLEAVQGIQTCTVINVSSRSFVVTLPLAGERHISPKKGSVVEGSFLVGETLFSFESTIEETLKGGVFACRIRHVEKLTQTHQRTATRLDLSRPIRYSHFAGVSVESGRVEMGQLQRQLSGTRQGVLRDISVGGAAIVAKADEPVNVGDFVQFLMQLQDDDPPYAVLGQIVHISPSTQDEGGNQQVLHVQFLGLDEEAQGCIARSVHRLKKEEEKV